MQFHEAFENNSLEVRAVFLDISKAFDKVWHDGLIFKLRHNGVSGKLLKFFESYLHNIQDLQMQATKKLVLAPLIDR